jgi:hypothetical protein
MIFRHCLKCNQRWELGTASACKCPDWTLEEDEAFNDVEKHSNLGKQILRELGQPYHFDIFVSPSQRNQVLEEVALEFDKMTNFGDTAASFAVFVRGMKQ